MCSVTLSMYVFIIPLLLHVYIVMFFFFNPFLGALGYFIYLFHLFVMAAVQAVSPRQISHLVGQ